MDALWQLVSPWLVEAAWRLGAAALVFVVGWLALRLLTGPLRRALGRSRIDPAAAAFLVNSARAALLCGVLLTALNQLGVPTASLLTLLGAAGLAVALSLQGSLANFASGLVLLWFRSVHVGDWIEVGDARGRVVDLLPFHVVLVTADHQRLNVPNTLLTNGVLRNHTAMLTRQARWALPVAAATDLDAAKRALQDRLLADPRVLREPPPAVFVQEWGVDRRVLGVTAWTAAEDLEAVQRELLEALGRRLDRPDAPDAAAVRAP
jgi:small conductance mechanosensitive channel